jgi:hypothetical protein
LLDRSQLIQDIRAIRDDDRLTERLKHFDWQVGGDIFVRDERSAAIRKDERDIP